jgi:hypothetical protein
MSFWNSDLIKNLEGGKLPELQIKVETQTFIELAVSIVIAGVAIILIYKILK